MAAARVGTSSLIGSGTHSSLIGSGTHSSLISSANQKLTARIVSNARRQESSAQVVNSTHQLKRVWFPVGKRVDSIASNSQTSKRNVLRNACRNVSPVASGSGDLGDNSDTEDNGCVHLGRRAVLGALVTAVALSRFEKPGVAVVNGKKANSESKTEEKGKENAEPGKDWKLSRVYDATVLGEPEAIGGEQSHVWQKLLQARVVYLGEAEHVPDADDRVLELGIVRKLRDACFELHHPVSLAVDAFPVTLQKSLDRYMDKRISDDQLKAMVGFWPDGLWQEYLPLLQYCRANGVRLMACGTPPEVLRTIQAKGIRGLNAADRKKYVPPVGGFGAVSIPFIDQLALADITPNAYGPISYQFSQARIVADHVMTEVVEKAMIDGGFSGLLIVITGASHVCYGSRGTGLPARVQKKLMKKTQAVVLLNPARQRIRAEGDVPEADFLWYSATRACNRNCFDRAEVARVMDAAGRRRDALPKDIQAGLERGLVDPQVLKSFFELDQHPIIAELTRRFQGLRERWLADPRFLQRLAIEESICVTTSLIAQYKTRGDRFLRELEYVITDTVRAVAVDFFTVWLPAPTLSFRSLDSQVPGGGVFEGMAGLLGSLPDNAFQRARVGESYDLSARGLAVILGGLKLFVVGMISSIGTLSLGNGVWAIRKAFNPEVAQQVVAKRSPMFKSAIVYGGFMGLSSNLRYQAIAGIVEHWIADYFLASQPLAGSALSFAARITNSYVGVRQWVGLARMTGLQSSEDEAPPLLLPEVQEPKHESDSSLEANTSTVETHADAVLVPQEAEPTRTP